MKKKKCLFAGHEKKKEEIKGIYCHTRPNAMQYTKDQHRSNIYLYLFCFFFAWFFFYFLYLLSFRRFFYLFRLHFLFFFLFFVVFFFLAINLVAGKKIYDTLGIRSVSFVVIFIANNT